jgi:hypothetical protein
MQRRTENARDDAAEDLRSYDRAPEAVPSHHLWRGTLPTHLAVGDHMVEVRFLDPGTASSAPARPYRLNALAQ